MFLIAFLAVSCILLSSCFKGEKCWCEGEYIGYVDDCYTACFGDK